LAVGLGSIVLPLQAGASAPSVKGFGSVEAAYLTAPARASVILQNAQGATVASGTVDPHGAYVAHDLVAASGYRFTVTSNGTVVKTPAFKVLSQKSPAPSSFYKNVKLHVGLNYIPMRDGITLAATVRLPWVRLPCRRDLSRP
jgi:hypothetical protein